MQFFRVNKNFEADPNGDFVCIKKATKQDVLGFERNEATGCRMIPEQVDGMPVIAVGPHSFEYMPVKAIELPESVIVVGNGAFYGCENLRKVTLKRSLAAIGDKAFAFCPQLCDINFPKDMGSIGALQCVGADVFDGCTQLYEDENFKKMLAISLALRPYSGNEFDAEERE